MKYIKIQKTVEFVVENILVILIYQRNSLTDSPTKFLNFGIKFKHTYSKLMRSFKRNYKNWFHPEITILDFTNCLEIEKPSEGYSLGKLIIG